MRCATAVAIKEALQSTKQSLSLGAEQQKSVCMN